MKTNSSVFLFLVPPRGKNNLKLLQTHSSVISSIEADKYVSLVSDYSTYTDIFRLYSEYKSVPACKRQGEGRYESILLKLFVNVLDLMAHLLSHYELLMHTVYNCKVKV